MSGGFPDYIFVIYVERRLFCGLVKNDSFGKTYISFHAMFFNLVIKVALLWISSWKKNLTTSLNDVLHIGTCKYLESKKVIFESSLGQEIHTLDGGWW